MSTKPKLLVNKSQVTSNWNTLGMQEFLNRFINCGEFDIDYHNDFVQTMRGERATILYYEGKSIYLDFWEYSSPTIGTDVLKRNFDLIIKLQHIFMTPEKFVETCKNKNVFTEISDEEKKLFWSKIVPWTFFPSRLLRSYIENNNVLNTESIQHMGFFCGKDWRCRGGMKRAFQKAGIEYIVSDQALRSCRPLTDEKYVEKMISSKYGIVLHGRASAFTDCKNRREIDYMFLKKPLLLNYRPYYYNPLIEGKHYIYINEKTDFSALEKMYNISEIAKNGYQWYLDNASPQGMISVFKQITKERSAFK